MSNSDVQPGATETQQMRVIAPPGVSPCPKVPADKLMCASIGTVECAATIARGIHACWSSNTGSGRFLGIPSRTDWISWAVISGALWGRRCALLLGLFIVMRSTRMSECFSLLLWLLVRVTFETMF